MSRYETVFIVTPTIPEDEVESIVAGLEEVVAGGGGTLHKTDRWGRKKLAYAVRKHREGNYTLLLYDSDAEVVRELERRIRMNDRVIRFMTVRADDATLPTAEEKEALAAARAEARRRAEERAAHRREAAQKAAEAGEEFSVMEWERQADEEERRVRAAARAAAEAERRAALAPPPEGGLAGKDRETPSAKEPAEGDAPAPTGEPAPTSEPAGAEQKVTSGEADAPGEDTPASGTDPDEGANPSTDGNETKEG